MKSLGRVGVIGRWKPLHNGGARLLETLCRQADHVTIGIGSSNKYNARNPFTAEESAQMIDAYLSPNHSNYNIIHIPDFAHIPEYSDGKRWLECMVEQYGELDHFISGNAYVANLMADTYKIIQPHTLIPDDGQVRLKATEVRIRMAQGQPWQHLVPEPVAGYITKQSLDQRFRQEFGLEVLASLAHIDYSSAESKEAEYLHTTER